MRRAPSSRGGSYESLDDVLIYDGIALANGINF
jgi:hypothetical protein